MDENEKQEFAQANAVMQEEFAVMYSNLTDEQRVGVIALVALIAKHRMQAGYKVFCRAVVQMLKDGRLVV